MQCFNDVCYFSQSRQRVKLGRGWNCDGPGMGRGSSPKGKEAHLLEVRHPGIRQRETAAAWVCLTVQSAWQGQEDVWGGGVGFCGSLARQNVRAPSEFPGEVTVVAERM